MQSLFPALHAGGYLLSDVRLLRVIFFSGEIIPSGKRK